MSSHNTVSSEVRLELGSMGRRSFRRAAVHSFAPSLARSAAGHRSHFAATPTTALGANRPSSNRSTYFLGLANRWLRPTFRWWNTRMTRSRVTPSGIATTCDLLVFDAGSYQFETRRWKQCIEVTLESVAASRAALSSVRPPGGCSGRPSIPVCYAARELVRARSGRLRGRVA